MSKDNINPPHYKNKTIETIEVIKSQMTEAEFVGYLKGSILKYTCRMGFKVPTLEGAREDAGKAHWYVEYLLKTLTDLMRKYDNKTNVVNIFKKEDKDDNPNKPKK